MNVPFWWKRNLPLLLLILLGGAQTPWVQKLAQPILDWEMGVGIRLGTITGGVAILIAIGIWQGWW